MSVVLGLSTYRREAAAVLIDGGVTRCAIQEERLVRRRDDAAYPRRAIRAVLDAAGMRASDLDAVVVSERPLRRFERVLASHVRAFPRGSAEFRRSMFGWLGDHLWMRARIAADLEISAKQVRFVEHLRAHAASCEPLTDDPHAAFLVLDDVGEWATTLLARRTPNGIESLTELRFPHSLGLFASAITAWIGRTPGLALDPAHDIAALDELAAHGSPALLDRLRGIVGGADHGSFELRPEALRPERAVEDWLGEDLAQVLEAPEELRDPDERDRRVAEVAASTVALLSEHVAAIAAELRRRAPDARDLVVSGLVARLPRVVRAATASFERVITAPWPDDAGTALGAARLAARAMGDELSADQPLGSGVRVDDLALQHDGDARPDVAGAARTIVGGAVIAWVEGALPFGDGGRGARSVFTSAVRGDACDAVLSSVQRGDRWQRTRLCLTRDGARALELDPGSDLCPASEACRRAVPAAVTRDGFVSLLVVDPNRTPLLAQLLGQLADVDVPALLETDFRLRSGPLVRSEAEALDDFERTTIDRLYVSGVLAATRDEATRALSTPPDDGDESGVGIERTAHEPVEP